MDVCAVDLGRQCLWSSSWIIRTRVIMHTWRGFRWLDKFMPSNQPRKMPARKNGCLGFIKIVHLWEFGPFDGWAFSPFCGQFPTDLRHNLLYSFHSFDPLSALQTHYQFAHRHSSGGMLSMCTWAFTLTYLQESTTEMHAHLVYASLRCNKTSQRDN